jgi:hypothetical protein
VQKTSNTPNGPSAWVASDYPQIFTRYSQVIHRILERSGIGEMEHSA